MSRTRLRDADPGLAAVLSALALAGCGGGSTSTASFVEAADAAQSADTIRFSMTGTFTAEGESWAMEGHGATDTSAGRTAFTMTMPKSLDIEAAVMAGTKIYLRMPTLKDELPGLKPWIELDLQRLGQAEGIGFQALADFPAQTDLLTLMAYLRAAGSAEEVGSEEIRGVETTHYRSEVDLPRDADIVADENPRAAWSIRRREADGELIVPLDVWIDEDDLVRRLSFEQSLPDGSSFEVTVDLNDFGADVDVALPSREDVTSYGELLERARGG